VSRFQTRHYQAIAEVMQAARRHAGDCETARNMDGQLAGIDRVERELVALFASDNSMFQAERFRRACVPGANVRARS
jgi:hypothetical protein